MTCVAAKPRVGSAAHRESAGDGQGRGRELFFWYELRVGCAVCGDKVSSGHTRRHADRTRTRIASYVESYTHTHTRRGTLVRSSGDRLPRHPSPDPAWRSGPWAPAPWDPDPRPCPGAGEQSPETPSRHTHTTLTLRHTDTTRHKIRKPSAGSSKASFLGYLRRARPRSSDDDLSARAPTPARCAFVRGTSRVRSTATASTRAGRHQKQPPVATVSALARPAGARLHRRRRVADAQLPPCWAQLRPSLAMGWAAWGAQQVEHSQPRGRLQSRTHQVTLRHKKAPQQRPNETGGLATSTRQQKAKCLVQAA